MSRIEDVTIECESKDTEAIQAFETSFLTQSHPVPSIPVLESWTRTLNCFNESVRIGNRC